ncbi:MAG: phosphoribosylformylglycinamidine cyclo-ligase, partial [Firmicutes bacterium]|nr:phosphoribosylformylglycinamidine cyclo-ligase [Bacillota bacterium]
CMTVSKETADAAIAALKAEGVDAYRIGEIVKSDEKVELC